MKRKTPPPDEALAWAAYCTAQHTQRLFPTRAEMTAAARSIWLDIARQRIAAGWPYPFDKEPPHA